MFNRHCYQQCIRLGCNCVIMMIQWTTLIVYYNVHNLVATFGIELFPTQSLVKVSSLLVYFVLIITLSECLPEGLHIYIMKLICTIVFGVHPVCYKSIVCLLPVPIFEVKRFLRALQKPALYPHRYYKVKKLNEKQWGLNCKKIDLTSQIRQRCVLAALKVVKN